MRILLKTAILVMAFAPGVALAQQRPEPRDANNESSCLAAGMGMDPRCVGDVDPGQEFAAPSEAITQDATPVRHAARIPAARSRHL
jgi:hypothetical protein